MLYIMECMQESGIIVYMSVIGPQTCTSRGGRPLLPRLFPRRGDLLWDLPNTKHFEYCPSQGRPESIRLLPLFLGRQSTCSFPLSRRFGMQGIYSTALEATLKLPHNRRLASLDRCVEFER